uniref:Uncharacterized protein n=1 Tax=Globodera pallida TaxID=36090 RepID=A0A183BVW8_GLOPA
MIPEFTTNFSEYRSNNQQMDAHIQQQPAQRHEGDSSSSRFTFSIPFDSTA